MTIQIETIPTELFGANCYLVYKQDQVNALVVDPGLGSAGLVAARLEELGKTVGAVLLTHGHPDHTWDAAAVASLDGTEPPAPVYLPGPDMPWLADPLRKLNLPELPSMTQAWASPASVVEVPVDAWEVLPGIVLNVVPAPGHTAGSSIVLIGGEATVDGAPPLSQVAFSSDVIFAGSIGRTDLPGGDDQEMNQTLRTLAVALDPATTLLPGHGPPTIWSEELVSNTYVRRARGER